VGAECDTAASRESRGQPAYASDPTADPSSPSHAACAAHTSGAGESSLGPLAAHTPLLTSFPMAAITSSRYGVQQSRSSVSERTCMGQAA
jgi:hypothetical protein